ncbi:MAG: hypothetical protein PVH25_08000 [Burkholderiales bacterium]|jgi:hypothetical protein
MYEGVLAIWNDCLPEVEKQYEDWYMHQHLPERVGVPGFRIGRRYQALAAEPRYFTYYDTDTPEVLWSQPYRERLANPTAETAEIMKFFRNMSRTVCRRVSQTGHFVAGNVVTVRLDRLPEDAQQLQEVLMGSTGVTGGEIWQAVEVPDDAASVESKYRIGPDDDIGAALIFHVMREQDALDASDILSRAFRDQARIGAYQLLCELRRESLE